MGVTSHRHSRARPSGSTSYAPPLWPAVVAVKVEAAAANGAPPSEWEAVRKLKGVVGVPRCHYIGPPASGDKRIDSLYNVLIMDVLGPNLHGGWGAGGGGDPPSPFWGQFTWPLGWLTALGDWA